MPSPVSAAGWSVRVSDVASPGVHADQGLFAHAVGLIPVLARVGGLRALGRWRGGRRLGRRVPPRRADAALVQVVFVALRIMGWLIAVVVCRWLVGLGVGVGGVGHRSCLVIIRHGAEPCQVLRVVGGLAIGVMPVGVGGLGGRVEAGTGDVGARTGVFHHVDRKCGSGRLVLSAAGGDLLLEYHVEEGPARRLR